MAAAGGCRGACRPGRLDRPLWDDRSFRLSCGNGHRCVRHARRACLAHVRPCRARTVVHVRCAFRVRLPRMAVLACANAVALFVLSCLIAGDGGTALTVVQIFAPYFITVGGCLAAARRMSASGRLSLRWLGRRSSLPWRTLLAVKLPWVYELASWWIWAVVVVAAIAWALFEVRRWLSDTRILSWSSRFRFRVHKSMSLTVST